MNKGQKGLVSIMGERERTQEYGNEILANRVSLCSELCSPVSICSIPSFIYRLHGAVLIASAAPQSFQQPDALFFCEVWLPLPSEFKLDRL